jgi:hypothetical protein
MVEAPGVCVGCVKSDEKRSIWKLQSNQFGVSTKTKAEEEGSDRGVNLLFLKVIFSTQHYFITFYVDCFNCIR